MHSQQLTTSYPVLVCLLNTGTLIQSAMLGFNSIFRLSCTVLHFHYISGAVIIQQAGPEVRCISQFTVHRLRASLQRHPPSPPRVRLGVRGATLPFPLTVGTDRNRPLLYLPMDHYLRQHGSKKNINKSWRLRSILLHRWVRYLDSFKNLAHPRWVRPSKLLAFAKSSLQPRHLPVPLRAHYLSFKRFLMWGSDRKLSPSECFLKTTNIDIADSMEKLAYLGCSVPKSTASSLAWVGQIFGCACLIFSHSKCYHGPRSNLLAKTRFLFKRDLFNFATCVKLSLFVSVLPILFIVRWQLGSLCLPMLVYEQKTPRGLKVGSCGFTDVAIHGVCRNPKPRGVSNMP